MLAQTLILIAIFVLAPLAAGWGQVLVTVRSRRQAEAQGAPQARRGLMLYGASFFLWVLVIDVMMKEDLAFQIGRLPLAALVLVLHFVRVKSIERLLIALNPPASILRPPSRPSWRLRVYRTMLQGMEWPIIWVFLALRTVCYDPYIGWVIWTPGLIMLAVLLPILVKFADRVANLLTWVESPPNARLVRAVERNPGHIRSVSLVRSGGVPVSEFRYWMWRNHLAVSDSLLESLDDEELDQLILQTQWWNQQPLSKRLTDSLWVYACPLLLAIVIVGWAWIVDPNGPMSQALGSSTGLVISLLWLGLAFAITMTFRMSTHRMVQRPKLADAWTLENGGSPEALSMALLKCCVHERGGDIDPVRALEDNVLPEFIRQRLDLLGVSAEAADSIELDSRTDLDTSD